jgi:hypothetical protein
MYTLFSFTNIFLQIETNRKINGEKQAKTKKTTARTTAQCRPFGRQFSKSRNAKFLHAQKFRKSNFRISCILIQRILHFIPANPAILI